MGTTPHISGLAIRLAAPARLLATRLAGKRRIPKSAAASSTTPAAGAAEILLDGFLHVPVLPADPSAAERAATRSEYAAMADDGRWAQLFAAMRAADHARTAGPAGSRLARIISEGGRHSLAEKLACHDWDGAQERLERLAAVQAAHADDPMAAHLLAQAHLDYGWMRRSAEPGPGIPRFVWQEFVAHTALAEQALGAFDPIEENSPLLAGTRYMLVRGIEDGDAQCRDWYEDWSDLDPTDPEPHQLHAQHMLPQWFGSLHEVEHEARLAQRRTRYRTGAAAYAVFQLSAAETLGDLPAGVDIGLFLDGLRDYADALACQHRANVVAAALTELHHGLGDAGVADRQRVHEALDHHLRQVMQEFHLDAWENGTASISYALRQVFGAELDRGEHLFQGTAGIAAQRPA